MKIKTKSQLLVLMICILFAILYFFVFKQMQGLDLKITQAMVGHRISELLKDIKSSGQDYLRTGHAYDAEEILEDLQEIKVIAGRTQTEFSLGMPRDSIREIETLANLYENNFKEILDLKPQAVAEEEILVKQGVVLQEAVDEVLNEIKRNPSLENEPISAKVDKITLANKILKEGHSAVKTEAPQPPPRRGHFKEELSHYLNQKWNEDALIKAASDYSRSFDVVNQLESELNASLQKLHDLMQQLDTVLLPAITELDKRRDAAKEAVMTAIFLAFIICGLLGLFLSFWLSQIITGPLLRLRNAMLQIASGDLNAVIDVGGRDEIGELALSFQAMQSKLKTSYEELHQINEKLAEKTKALEHSNGEFEQFAHVISHDLKEPIRTVSIYTDLLAKRMDGRTEEKDHEYIQQILGGCKWMYSLIDDLLAYASLDSQNKASQNTDAGESLTKALNNLAVVIETNQAHVTHDQLPVVQADMTRLTQLFQNLIANAIKFRRKEAPKIHVGAQFQDGLWLFEVRDNGIGIDVEHDADRVFFIFQRLHTRKEYPGTGMGLAICKKVVEQYGGKIWLESKPGEGSAFYFTLPSAKEGSL